TSSNEQTTTYVIDLENGNGSGMFDVKQSRSYVHTFTPPNPSYVGELWTDSTSSLTNGGASVSWPAGSPGDPLLGTGISRTRLTLKPGEPTPAYCTTN